MTPEHELPLEGWRVLDLATFIAAPFCASLLGDFGAEVIKVEMPGQGDHLRVTGKKLQGISLWWVAESRNKKSITCHLKKKEGQELILKLVQVSDILVENFRPGTLEKWNLGYENLKGVNPGLIIVRISGYGQTGPYGEKPSFGRIAGAFGGMSYITGYPDRAPVNPGTPTIPDYLAGAFGAIGALIAKVYKDRTGDGQVVDVGLYEPMIRMLDEAIPVYDRLGYVRERLGPAAEAATPHSHYQCKDQKWVAIACTTQRMFERLAGAMGRLDLFSDPGFKDMASRLQNRAKVDKLVQDWVGRHTIEEVLRRLDEAEVPVGPLNSVKDLMEHPQIQARENIVEVNDTVLGRVKIPGILPRLSLTPGSIRQSSPSYPGEHNEEIYRRLLGISAEEITRLKSQGVI